MTKLLNSAFEEISKLPELEQNIFARFIIDEINSEKKWEKNLANSEDLLSNMANIALSDFKNNKCIELK
ncbi:hypothetical protein CJ671_08475 [Aliarcobacter cryaerophilus]|uniref:DUF2281 domain-containing protein n=1 Tax=Aliarcobacter cryaerophilus TaxID=28198 RepID=A0A2S9SQ97_9BACT|nr:hypothetical protein [Aliarcobacter cryaerophilus]PRM88746.1 hypothetical protein CJ671_08475 [Aliarcobacter cryaerophilus]